MNLRLDKLDAPSWMQTKFEKTSEGYLKGRAVITSTGIFEYLRGDGVVVKELRLPEEVFNPSFLESLKMQPVTMGHPVVKVTSENIKEVQIGTLGSSPSNPKDGTSDNYFLSMDMIIHDANAIRLIENGTRSLSVGYSCELEKAEINARWCGQKYDYIQKNLKANHLSIVEQGRQGDQAVIKLDDADAILVSDEKENKTDIVKEEIMAEEKKADTSEVKDAVKEAITEVRVDELQAKIDALTTEKTTLEAERDTLKDKVDSLEKKVGELEAAKMDVDGKKTDIKRLIKLIDSARLAEVEVTDAMSEIDIQKAVIVKIFPKANLDGKDEVYINARFDGAMEALENKNDEEVRKLSSDDTVVVDSEENIVDKARKAYLDRLTGKK